MLTVSHYRNPITYNIYEIKYTKNLNDVLKQNVNGIKRAKFAAFALNHRRQFVVTAAVYVEHN